MNENIRNSHLHREIIKTDHGEREDNKQMCMSHTVWALKVEKETVSTRCSKVGIHMAI